MLGALLLLGIVGLSLTMNRKPSKPSSYYGPPSTAVSGEDPTAHIKALSILIRDGHHPQRWLVNEAMREAFELGHWETLAKLTIAFQTQSTGETPNGETPNGEVPTPDEIDDSPPEDASRPQIVIGANSPLEGVTNDEWQEFVGKLKTQPPSFKNERAVGAYHHNIERLSQLGIDPLTLTDEQAQQAAIARDLAEYRKTERKLTDDFGGDLIQINGETYPITLSGILGVVKAAGPKNARSWFKNAEDRAAHPHTTETFLRTNGVF